MLQNDNKDNLITSSFNHEGLNTVKSNKNEHEFNFQGIKGNIVLDIVDKSDEGPGIIKFNSGEEVKFFKVDDMIHFEGFLSSDVRAFLYDEVIRILDRRKE